MTTKNFVLEYSAEADEALGLGVRRISSKLIIRSDFRQAFLEKHRSQSDRAGEPIGTFQADMSDQALSNILVKANAMIVPEQPPAKGEGPGSTVITIRFEEGARKITRIFTSGDMSILSAVEGLINDLDLLSGQVERHPLSALQAMIEYKSGPYPYFLLTLKNIGQTRICFADPRFLPQGDPDCWAGAQVAELPEEKPGMTAPPLQWKQVPLEMPAHPAPTEPIVIEPGKSFSAKTVTWQNLKPNAPFLAQGVYSDYTGPAEIAGVYRIRGATFSEGMEFIAK